MKLRQTRIIAVLALLAGAAFAGSGNLGGIFLPGTQPEVVESFDSPLQCLACHAGENSGLPVTIGTDWQGSMMGHSARDPIFYAAVAIANKYREGSGEFCIRCHSPGGWLEGRSDPPTGEGLIGADLQGVQCDVCHRMKDPAIPDSTANPAVPGSGNGMMVMQVPLYPKRGPFADAFQFHSTLQDTFQVSSDLCGTCHNVSNPFYADDPVGQSPHEYSPIERTYSEWLLSSFSSMGDEGTCQSCHMARTTGYGCVVPGVPLRDNLPMHDLTGGNTFVPDILYDFWGDAVDTTALRLGKERAEATLQRAASIEAGASWDGDTLLAEVTVTNLTGHKLPTGYPEGRRAWLSVTGMNANGDTVFESGAYDFETADLTLDDQIKIYEAKPGLTAKTAAEFGLDPGPSFHFVLNDSIFFDNRIPPQGFSNGTFATHGAGPVGYSYLDGEFSDRTIYRTTAEVAIFSFILYYQTASKEYITFLRDENAGNVLDWNAWGDSLYAAWERHGKSKPAIIDSLTISVVSTGIPEAGVIPLELSLFQNYPNPFNPATTIAFALSRPAEIRLAVSDILGQEIALLTEGSYSTGTHEVHFTAENLPSGIYFYTLFAGTDRVATRKLILMK